MSELELDKSYFVAFCIEQYKEHRGISGAESTKLWHLGAVTLYDMM